MKYIYFEIKTEYSQENFFCENNTESVFDSIDNFLCENCFCDDYDVISYRNATTEEEKQIEEKLEENVDLWKARQKIIL